MTDRFVIGGLLLLVSLPAVAAYFLFELRLARRASLLRTSRYDGFPYWVNDAPTVTGATAGADVHQAAAAHPPVPAAAGRTSVVRLVEDLADEGDTLGLRMMSTALDATYKALNTDTHSRRVQS